MAAARADICGKACWVFLSEGSDCTALFKVVAEQEGFALIDQISDFIIFFDEALC
jgi:hypothetical protein